jgi:hypothetical protein
VTVVPAGLGIAAFVVCLLVALTPTDLSRRLEGFAHRRGRVARFAQRAANLPASMSAGVRMALRLAREGSPALAATAAYWGFNIAVLWASFRAFGEAPPWPVLVQGYFVGMLGNLLPLPGGVGHDRRIHRLRGGRGACGGRRPDLPGVRLLAADPAGCHRLHTAAQDGHPLEGGAGNGVCPRVTPVRDGVLYKVK